MMDELQCCQTSIGSIPPIQSGVNLFVRPNYDWPLPTFPVTLGIPGHLHAPC
jgi:hypothetical protein